jgi:epsilon-lactone hydrolase
VPGRRIDRCVIPTENESFMASPEANAFHAMVRGFRDATIGTSDTLPTIDEMRAGADMTMQMVGVARDGVVVSERTLAGRRTVQVDPAGARTDRVVLYLHGGGYVMNSIDTHTKIAGGLAAAAGCRGLVFDYRMAPEDPFPAAVDDALAAYRALLDEGIPASSIVVAGDSAGGGLTVAALVSASEAGLPQPAAAVLFSPWTDLEGVGASMDANLGVDLMIERATMSAVGQMYLAGADVRSPLASVIYADLTGLAPMLIQVGGHEVLLDDSTRLAVNAAHAGVAVTLDVFPEMQHVFQTGLGQLPESDDALARAGSYIKRVLGP